MDKYDIVQKIEDFAAPALAEKWDCTGWAVETERRDVRKVMLALTVTQDVVNQALAQNCDMIISHHPLFKVPLSWKNIDIYSAHTNMDKTQGGTTDILIKELGFDVFETCEFVRYVKTDVLLEDFLLKLKRISSNLRYVNNSGVKELHKIAFCGGSGSEFIQEAYEFGADAFVTGDLKFHTALESPIVLFDIGHFESEILVLDLFEKLVGVECVHADEKSPFKY